MKQALVFNDQAEEAALEAEGDGVTPQPPPGFPSPSNLVIDPMEEAVNGGVYGE